MELSDIDDPLLLEWAERLPGETLAEKLAVDDGGIARAFRSRYTWYANRHLPRRYHPLPADAPRHAPPPIGDVDWDADQASRDWRRRRRRPSRNYQPLDYDDNDTVPLGRWQRGD